MSAAYRIVHHEEKVNMKIGRVETTHIAKTVRPNHKIINWNVHEPVVLFFKYLL